MMTTGQKPLSRGIPIRSISRALTVLIDISHRGPVSMKEVAMSTGLPYPTVSRIIQTLQHEGAIEREPAQKLYRVTPLVLAIASGFQKEDQLAKAARPHIEALTKEHGWPVSISTRIGTRMLVRDTTHAISSLTFSRHNPGFTMPIGKSASGKCYLCFCDDDELEQIKDGLNAIEADDHRAALYFLTRQSTMEIVRKRGCAMELHAANATGPSKTSTIAVPIFSGDVLLGTLALIYFSSAYGIETATEAFRDLLADSARKIGADFDNVRFV